MGLPATYTWKFWVITQSANIVPEDVPRASSSNFPRTSPKDPVWPFWWCPNLTSLGCPHLKSWGRPGMKSRGRRNLTFKGRSWEVDLGRPQDVFKTSPRGSSKHPQTSDPKISFNFSLRTYSIDQIYLKAFQHSRCIENPVKLLRLSISCEIS